MPGASLDFDLSGLTSTLDRLQARLADLTPLMEEIGSSLLTSSQERFESKTAPDGSRWATLAAATIRDRLRRNYSAGDILLRSGSLRNSLNYRPGSDQVIVSMGGAGNSTAYARAQQMGYEKLKARPVLGLSTEDKQSVSTIADRFLEESL